MTTQAMLDLEFSAQASFDENRRRGYVRPTVQPLAFATAHPSTECWPGGGQGRQSVAPIRAEQTPEGPRPRLRLIKGTRVAPKIRSGATADVAFRFEALQRRMRAVEASARAGRPHTLVIVPSRTIDKWHEPPAETQAYEERLLCALLGLRDPALHITYVTSSPIAPGVIDYYLSLLPRRIRTHARSRLTLVALGERTVRPLSQKLLERPLAVERIRRTISDPDTCYLVPYNTTALERDVALALGVAMYGADPELAYLGTKSGCRELFSRAGVPHPAGREGITSMTEAVNAVAQLRRFKPGLSRLVLKLNEGVSGEGNALIDLEGLPEPGSPDEADLIARRVEGLAPEAPGVTSAAFLAKLADAGGIVEEWITAREIRSPSAQLLITASGEVQLISTHDQILGGPHGQSYLGCRFPAAPAYAPVIAVLARRVGHDLADAGVIGRFAIDFVVARDVENRWRPFAIELNLRKGGTTHPYETLAHLTDGSYDAASATFLTPTGQTKHYVATDHMEAPQLRQLGLAGVLNLTRRGALGFDRMRRTGTVFHMLSSLDELGRTGFTAVGDSPEEAQAIYDDVHTSLLVEHGDPAGGDAAERAESEGVKSGTIGAWIREASNDK